MDLDLKFGLDLTITDNLNDLTVGGWIGLGTLYAAGIWYGYQCEKWIGYNVWGMRPVPRNKTESADTATPGLSLLYGVKTDPVPFYAVERAENVSARDLIGDFAMESSQVKEVKSTPVYAMSKDEYTCAKPHLGDMEFMSTEQSAQKLRRDPSPGFSFAYPYWWFTGRFSKWAEYVSLLIFFVVGAAMIRIWEYHYPPAKIEQINNPAAPDSGVGFILRWILGSILASLPLVTNNADDAEPSTLNSVLAPLTDSIASIKSDCTDLEARISEQTASISTKLDATSKKLDATSKNTISDLAASKIDIERAMHHIHLLSETIAASESSTTNLIHAMEDRHTTQMATMEARFKSEMANMENSYEERLAAMDNGYKERSAAMEDRFSSQIASMEHSYSNKIAVMKQSCAKEVTGIKESCGKEITGIKNSCSEQLAAMDDRHSKQIADMRTQMAAMEDRITGTEDSCAEHIGGMDDKWSKQVADTKNICSEQVTGIKTQMTEMEGRYSKRFTGLVDMCKDYVVDVDEKCSKKIASMEERCSELSAQIGNLEKGMEGVQAQGGSPSVTNPGVQDELKKLSDSFALLQTFIDDLRAARTTAVASLRKRHTLNYNANNTFAQLIANVKQDDFELMVAACVEATDAELRTNATSLSSRMGQGRAPPLPYYPPPPQHQPLASPQPSPHPQMAFEATASPFKPNAPSHFAASPNGSN
jgi:hypothetical protein